jgi:ribonuclease BN (tRNA processing enzyme)
MNPVRVTFLGSGDSFSASGCRQPGYLVHGGTPPFLFDCGASTLTAMKREQLDPATLDLVLISHLHGDHFAGLPFLFLEYNYETQRRRPLRIVGPPGTEERVRALFRATYKELSAKPLGFALEFTELHTTAPLELPGVHVEPFHVPHQEKEISLGFRVAVDGRSLCYSGDTGWTEELIARARGTDLFICECSYYETRQPFHLDYPRIAEHRADFGTKRLILTHLGREVHAHRGELDIELATDGLTVEL